MLQIGWTRCPPLRQPPHVNCNPLSLHRFLAGRATQLRIDDDRKSDLLGLTESSTSPAQACSNRSEHKKREDVREEYRLVLCCPTHVVVGIVGQLEDVRREAGLLRRCVAVFGGIFVQDCVRVTWYVFVGVHGDEGGGSDGGVDVVIHEPFADARDNDVLRDRREGREVRDGLELLRGQRRLPIHDGSGEMQHRAAAPGELRSFL
ncbi:hypothetical protein FKP32DRAFT_505701 [Trametes sanguinea]|nr:hypothetical protein FKP32DRAFT_505701 [Trametes sanguinea]